MTLDQCTGRKLTFDHDRRYQRQPFMIAARKLTSVSMITEILSI